MVNRTLFLYMSMVDGSGKSTNFSVMNFGGLVMGVDFFKLLLLIPLAFIFNSLKW